MTFVNDKLGNGFVIKSANSSLDYDHYFTGYKKYIKCRLRALTGTLGTTLGGTSFEFDTTRGDNLFNGAFAVVTSSSGIVAHAIFSCSLYDWQEYNTLEIISGALTTSSLEDSESYAFLKSVTGDINQVDLKIPLKISFEFSRSQEGSSPATTVSFVDSNSVDWEDWPSGLFFAEGSAGASERRAKLKLTEIDTPEEPFTTGSDDQGWIRVEYIPAIDKEPMFFRTNLSSSSPTNGSKEVHFYLDFTSPPFGGNAKIRAYRKFEVELLIPVTNDGVKFLRENDNQVLEKNATESLQVGVFSLVE
jgi:hypothetical protein